MKFAITGAMGFLGWHARCALRARGHDFVSIDRPEWADQRMLSAQLADVDAVLHLAGANRAEPRELRETNLGLAQRLTEALDRSGPRTSIVYANSIHAGDGTPFGDSKQAAAEHLSDWGRTTGASVVDAHLPNIFGEHGRPHYNSVVATFCHLLATGGHPIILEDREVPLLHAQDAVDALLELAEGGQSGTAELASTPIAVSNVLWRLQEMRDLYKTGQIPVLNSAFQVALFNTYRSFTFPSHFPIHPESHSDERGELVECIRVHGGQSQVFCSTTRPGYTRGEHFHLRKVERFQVLSGTAVIALRRLFDDHVVRFSVSGKTPAIIDMPTMWAHSITNTGSKDAITLFWSHELLDSSRPDTFREPVMPQVQG